MDSNMKTSAGRLRDMCAQEVHRLRAAYDEEGRPVKPAMTYLQIANKLGVTPGTIYNIVTGRTHRDDVPLGHPLHPNTRR